MDNESVRKQMAEVVGRRGQGAMQEIAKKTGLTPQWLSKYRTGKVNLGEESLRKVAAVLNEFARERQANYDPSFASEAESIVCRDLRYLLSVWEDPRTPLELKEIAVRNFVDTYNRAIAAFKLSKQG